MSGKSVLDIFFRSQESKRSIRRWGWIHLFMALLVFSANADTPPKESASISSIENMRVLAYSKEMAKRFGLPAPREGWETQPPLHAVEYLAESLAPKIKGHGCAYKLYLDSKLPLAFGDSGPVGGVSVYGPKQHFFARDWGNPLSRAANIALGERVSGFGRLALVATLDYVPDTRGASTDTGVTQTEYVRELLPGLTYLKLSGGCGMMSWEKRVNTVQLWLKKAAGKDYRKRVVPDPDDFIKLSLPSALYREAVTWRGTFDEEDREFVKEFEKNLRERQGKRNNNTQ